MGAAIPPSQRNADDLVTPQPMLSEINVVPFIDIMLVLLIVFMVSAPLMQQGIQVDLPKTKSPALSDQESQIVLVIDSAGNASINQNRIAARDLTAKLIAIYEKREKKEIYVQADRAAAYGSVAQVMSFVREGAIVTRNGKRIPTPIHTFCTHGDEATAAPLLREVRAALAAEGVDVVPLTQLTL